MQSIEFRSRRARGGKLVGIASIVAVVALVAALFSGSASAVHDEGVFQLDGNADTATQSAIPAREDWDVICKANLQSASLPKGCVKNPDVTLPSINTNANKSVFITDAFGGATDDIFTTGGSKDDLDISSWRFKNATPSPDKDDLEHAFAARYTCDTNAGCLGTQDDQLLYFGADRFSNSGDANIAFWLLQNKVSENGTVADPTICTTGGGCGFSGVHRAHGGGADGTSCYPNQTEPCPAGKTGADDTRGDVLIVSAFTGGGSEPGITAYEWVGKGNAPNSLKVTNDASVVPIPIPGQAATEGCLTAGLAQDAACALVNTGNITSPWTFTEKSLGATNTIAASEFYEGGLNLTELGLADECFSSFLVNTRSSQDVNSELHDYALGQLSSCAPTLTTQASTNSTVTPGTAVHDTATITVTGAGSPADPTGTVTFFLCGPIATGDCATGGTNVGTGTIVADATPTNGIASVDSPTVNDSAQTGNRGPLVPGRYCFRAEWPGDTTYPGALTATNDTTECFSVAKVPSKTVTTPSTTTVTLKAINDGGTITDTALVSPATGQPDAGFPTGTVSFFICGPIASGTCSTGGTAVTGNPVQLTNTTTTTPHTSTATSGAVGSSRITSVGRYCFRAQYSGDLNYNSSNDAGTGDAECFTVTDAARAGSAQNWLPNDRITIATAGGAPLTGTLSITLRSGSCTGPVKYTEPTNTSLSGVASGTSFNTTNGTFKVVASTAGTYYWRTVFTPTNTLTSPVTICETSTVSITN
jgi:hypothetical protein